MKKRTLRGGPRLFGYILFKGHGRSPFKPPQMRSSSCDESLGGDVPAWQRAEQGRPLSSPRQRVSNLCIHTLFEAFHTPKEEQGAVRCQAPSALPVWRYSIIACHARPRACMIMDDR